VSIGPRVSIVITTHNRAGLLPAAMHSVLAQTFGDFEVIVVDDGSTDATRQAVRAFEDPRIQYVRHEQKRGLSAARNTGLHSARGKYVAYLDDDDTWLPEKTALQENVLEAHSNKCLVYCGGLWMSGSAIESRWVPVARGLMKDFIYGGYTLPSSNMMVSREALTSIGGFSEDLVSCIDHDIWMKMAQAGFDMDFVPKELVVYRRHACSQMTTRLDERLHGIEQFFSKWKPYVTDECGASCWRSIEEVYHSQTMKTIRSEYRGGVFAREVALDYLRKLFSLQSQPFLWVDYLAFRAGWLSYTPVRSNTVKIAKGTATFPFRRLSRLGRKRALSNPE
jgi:glycosyltransferase involved in cell wall biosynthesis